MEPASLSLIESLTKMLYHVRSSSDDWKRLRIAVTSAEILEIRDYVKSLGQKEFITAFRAIPLIVEDHPKQPMYTVELL